MVDFTQLKSAPCKLGSTHAATSTSIPQRDVMQASLRANRVLRVISLFEKSERSGRFGEEAFFKYPIRKAYEPLKALQMTEPGFPVVMPR
jgi:hypothetical protein